MPSYDYRCNHCGRAFALFYQSVKDYEAASITCPHCHSDEVARRINRVAIARPSRNLANLSSGEMLSVLEGGDSREVGRLFQDVGDSAGVDMGETYQQATEQLLKGDSVQKVERDLRAQSGENT